jgi:5-phospho-D-xylono-1,4-lactonase
MSFVRTVTGDVDPSTLGITLCHEHLIIDTLLVAEEWPQIHLPSVAEAIAEADRCRGTGVTTMVDAMPWESGGDPLRLRQVSEATGISVVASTGMHTAKYYRGLDWAFEESADQLANRFMKMVTAGVSHCRAGVLKVATAGKEPTALERRLFEAAAISHASTGVPLLTHCEEGRGGMAQAELLTSLGMELAHVALSHTDKQVDPGYHRELLESGVNLCFDQGLRSPGQTARLIAESFALGLGDQVLIGTDGARRSLWVTLGGRPGLDWINTGFRELLIAEGLTTGDMDRLFLANPARWLTFAG